MCLRRNQIVQSSQPLIEKYLDNLQLNYEEIKIVIPFSPPTLPIRLLWQPFDAKKVPSHDGQTFLAFGYLRVPSPAEGLMVYG